MKNLINGKKKYGALFLSLIFIFGGCAHHFQNIKNFKEGETLVQPSEGLLIGSILVRQGENELKPSGLSSSEKLEILNIQTNSSIYHDLRGTDEIKGVKGTDFRLPLPSGQYKLQKIIATDIKLNRSTSSKIAPWLLNILTLPFGVFVFPGIGPETLELTLPYSDFEVKPHEATYIGTLIVDFPDPLPIGHPHGQFKVIDEGDQTTADLQNRIPGIERVVKNLLMVESK